MTAVTGEPWTTTLDWTEQEWNGKYIRFRPGAPERVRWDDTRNPDFARRQLENLAYHRDLYRSSINRWNEESIWKKFHYVAKGRWRFSTLDDLVFFHHVQRRLEGPANGWLSVLGDHLRRMRPWFEPQADLRFGMALGLGVIEVAQAQEWAMFGPNPSYDELSEVYLRELSFWDEPIFQAFEIRQLYSANQTAADMVEDRVCDLALELIASKGSDAVCHALNQDPLTLQVRIDLARARSGPPGDPRRQLRQIT